ncbi:MAG TPA: hypothetical protein VFD92_08630 [Candidatus Binatia bacterium]|nr:hypothetical protein [Candidatus Binatia bacterium]
MDARARRGPPAVVIDFEWARRSRKFADVARVRANAVVRIALSRIAPDGGTTLGLARPWPSERVESRLVMLCLEIWLDELRQWHQSIAGLHPGLLVPLVAAMRAKAIEIRSGEGAFSVGAFRLASLLCGAADRLEREADRLVHPSDRSNEPGD